MRRIALAVLSLLVQPAAAQKAPEKLTPGDEMIYKYLCAETDKLSQKFLDGAKTLDEWRSKRPRLHQEYMDMLGLWPIPEKTPLKATITGTFEHEGVIIDNLHFQSKPGLYVTANLYRPKAHGPQSVGLKRLPTILYVCGHSNKGRDGNKSAFQDHGLWFASNGYNCLVLDTLQLGEIPAVHHGTYGRPWNHLKAYGIKDKDKLENRWWWHSAGYTPAGVEAWNGVRAIDYLLSRPDVDPERLGVTGISGGGAATFWIACADDRVKVAVPVSGMSDLESYVKNKVVNGHCDCMFLYNTYQWEWTTIAALVAPRPLLFANSDNDSIFPMDGNRRIIDRLRTLYKMYGKPDLVDEYVSKGGHAYRPDLRIAVFQFLNKHLKGDTTSKVEDSAKYTPLDGRKLRVFPTDDDLPKDAINGRIDETFIPAAKVALPEKGKFAEWKQARLLQLRATVFRALPKDIPAAKLGKTYFESDGKKEWAPSMITEPGLELTAGPTRKSGKIEFLDVYGGDNPDEKTSNKVFEQFLAGKNFWFLFARGREISKKSPPNYAERSHLLLGQTVDAGQVRDIIATFKYIQKHEKATPAVLGVGTSGILAAYAALFEPSIKEVVIIDPPASHKEGPHFLGVLRVLDIPEALGLLAPNVKLTLINARDPAFDRTAAIYQAAGAADKLVRK